MPLPAIVHWEGNHWMVFYDVAETYVRVADPALGCARFRARNSSRSGPATPRSSITPTAFENAPESKPALAWILPFLLKFNASSAGNLLAIAVTFLQLLFPVFTQMVVDKVIVENDLGLLKTILLGMGVAVVFVQYRRLRSNICSPSPRSGSTPQFSTSSVGNSFAADDLFYQPSHGGYPAPARRRKTGSAIRRPARYRRAAFTRHLVGALALMAFYSPSLMVAFLVTTPLYVGLMNFSSILRPFLPNVEESQGKYALTKSTRSRASKRSKLRRLRVEFRDRCLTNFSASRRKCSGPDFI